MTNAQGYIMIFLLGLLAGSAQGILWTLLSIAKRMGAI